jgi:hypothetical protein
LHHFTPSIESTQKNRRGSEWHTMVQGKLWSTVAVRNWNNFTKLA